jgi:hypothetical protein
VKGKDKDKGKEESRATVNGPPAPATPAEGEEAVRLAAATRITEEVIRDELAQCSRPNRYRLLDAIRRLCDALEEGEHEAENIPDVED